MWKALHYKFLVEKNLMKLQNVQTKNICHLWGELNETVEHVLLRCPLA